MSAIKTPFVPFATYRRTTGKYRPPIVHWTSNPFPTRLAHGLDHGRSAWPQLYTVCGRYIDIIDRPLRAEDHPDADVCQQCQRIVDGLAAGGRP